MLKYKAMMLKILVAQLLVFVLLVSFPVYVTAQENISNMNIKVGHIANVVERFKEKIVFYFQLFPEKKIEYYKNLADKRLAEIAYATENDYGDRIEETASRYLTTIGRFTEYISSSGKLNNKQELIDMSDNHVKILENLRDRFPANSGWWLAIQHDINTIEMFSVKLDSLQ